MLNNYRKQIFFTLMLFVVVLFVLTAIITVRLVEKQQTESIRQTLLDEAETVAAMLNERSQPRSILVNQLEQTTGARITFIATDGTVIADSDADARRMDNHGKRPEIIDAGKQRFGSDIRTSSTTGIKMIYVAIALPTSGANEGYLRLSKSLSEVEAASTKIVSQLLLALLILFIVGALVSWRIARSLSQPVHELREVAEHITLNDFSRRVHYDKNNEVGQLGRSINEMADSLQLQMNRITDSEGRLKNVLDHLAVGIALTNDNGDILVNNPFLERFSKYKQLRGLRLEDLHFSPEFMQNWRIALEKKSDVAFEWRAYFPDERIIDVHFVPIASGMLITLHDLTSIRRLESMRSDFVANVSHELRTPLASIRGFAETLKLGALHDPESAAAFLQIILDESDRLNRLVNDLLDLSKIESNRLPLKYESINVSSLITEIAQLLDRELAQKRLKLQLLGEHHLQVEADHDRLRQIIINLLHNSIQYTPEGGSVNVSWTTNAEHLSVSVKDSGIGIPKEDVPHVFERFFRVDRARNRQSGGTGLGLSITKHLIEMHKGTISAESELGHGSTFIFTIPLKQADEF